MGNPWLLREIIENREFVITAQEKLNVIKEHLNLAIKEKGEYIAIREMRKHICWYIKNLKDSSKFREKINKIENVNELIVCLDEYFKTI